MTTSRISGIIGLVQIGLGWVVAGSVPCASRKLRKFMIFALGSSRCVQFGSRSQLTSRVVREELPEDAAGDGIADVRHKPLVESDIMRGNQQRAKHLARKKKVADGAAGEMPTGVAVASRLDRLSVTDEPAVAQSKRAAGGEGISVSPVA